MLAAGSARNETRARTLASSWDKWWQEWELPSECAQWTKLFIPDVKQLSRKTVPEGRFPHNADAHGAYMAVTNRIFTVFTEQPPLSIWRVGLKTRQGTSFLSATGGTIAGDLLRSRSVPLSFRRAWCAS